MDDKQKTEIQNKIRSFRESEARRARPSPKWAVRLGWASLVLIAASPLLVAAHFGAVNYAEYNSVNSVAIIGYLGSALVSSGLLALVLRSRWSRYKNPEMETFGLFKSLWKRIKRAKRS